MLPRHSEPWNKQLYSYPKFPNICFLKVKNEELLISVPKRHSEIRFRYYELIASYLNDKNPVASYEKIQEQVGVVARDNISEEHSNKRMKL